MLKIPFFGGGPYQGVSMMYSWRHYCQKVWGRAGREKLSDLGLHSTMWIHESKADGPMGCQHMIVDGILMMEMAWMKVRLAPMDRPKCRCYILWSPLKKKFARLLRMGKGCWQPYLLIIVRATRDVGCWMMFHPCFARRAWLWSRMCWKPRPPASFGFHSVSQACRRIFEQPLELVPHQKFASCESLLEQMLCGRRKVDTAYVGIAEATVRIGITLPAWERTEDFQDATLLVILLKTGWNDFVVALWIWRGSPGYFEWGCPFWMSSMLQRFHCVASGVFALKKIADFALLMHCPDHCW